MSTKPNQHILHSLQTFHKRLCKLEMAKRLSAPMPDDDNYEEYIQFLEEMKELTYKYLKNDDKLDNDITEKFKVYYDAERAHVKHWFDDNDFAVPAILMYVPEEDKDKVGHLLHFFRDTLVENS